MEITVKSAILQLAKSNSRYTVLHGAVVTMCTTGVNAGKSAAFSHTAYVYVFRAIPRIKTDYFTKIH
jgi:hypothetical protein